jgi:cellulose biosynthesis protein BcsQ
MTDQAPDDIFALFSRFDLDGDHYRVFHRETAKASERPTQSLRVANTSVEVIDASEPVTEIQRSFEEPVYQPPLAGPSTRLAHRTPTPIRPDFDPGRSSLQSLWRHVSNPRSALVGETSDSLAADSVSVTGVAGGVGATTISATLTRMLATTGRRCGLFDDTEDPALPIFFGTQRLAEEQRRFAGLRSIFELRARIVNRKSLEPIDAALQGTSFIGRNFATISRDFDHLIFDRPARSFDCSGAGVKICVAVPDLSSLARIQKAKQEIDLRDPDESTICVLNRFDASIPVHLEILGWYRENFRNLVVIRESPLVSEALAEGTTVVDWIPDSLVTTDFLNLFATVRHAFGAQSERIQVCS